MLLCQHFDYVASHLIRIETIINKTIGTALIKVKYNILFREEIERRAIVSLRLFLVGGFVSLFSILSHHLKYHETMDETTPYNARFQFWCSLCAAFNCKIRHIMIWK